MGRKPIHLPIPFRTHPHELISRWRIVPVTGEHTHLHRTNGVAHGCLYTCQTHIHISNLALFLSYDIATASKQTENSAEVGGACTNLTHAHRMWKHFSCGVFIRAIPLRKSAWLTAEQPDLSKSLLGGEGLASRCCETDCVSLHPHAVQSSPWPLRKLGGHRCIEVHTLTLSNAATSIY